MGMLHSNRIVRPLIFMLIGSLLTALLIPLATRSSWAGQQSITLAPGDQIALTCPTGMNGTAPGTQATLKCATPQPTAIPTAVAGPAISSLSGIQDGQVVSGKIAIVAQVSGSNIAQVVFKLDGPKGLTFTEKNAPFTFMGDVNGVPNGWNTTQHPNGDYMLTATATNNTGQSGSAMVHFRITNGATTPPATPTTAPAPTSAPAPTTVPPVGNGRTFVETFTSSPTNPQPWRPANWDVAVHSRDRDTWDTLQPMHAGHGGDCGAPPASHEIRTYEEAVFVCRDHVMTALKADGYGVIYMTPNQMVDFSSGEAVISWDMSTARTSGRDWVDLWITPFAENLELPLQDWLPDLSGPPRNAIHIFMNTYNGDTVWGAEVINNYVATDVSGSNWWKGWRTFLAESASRRDTFELRISRNRLKFGMPGYQFYWLDVPIPQQSWSQGVVQLGHHSYNPTKSDGCGSVCQPNTWHWDNVSISPATPFTIVRADRRTADAANGKLSFPAPAPANASLRFAGIGSNLAVSFDGGKTWQPAQLQVQSKVVEEHFKSYWMPIPAGTASVQVRGNDWWGGKWLVRDVSIWAQ
jgi:hypothetical protein